jgi:hypothetical protein
MLRPGVSILTGQNATNRTSFLTLIAGLGSQRCSLNGHADEGEVTHEIGNSTSTRTLRRRDGDEVVFGGDPYLDDPELADLFRVPARVQ